jgi:hypothetical protein
MNTIPLPLTAPPHDTVRPPKPRPTDDHRPHLSGGARYAIGYQSQADRPGAGSSQACAPVGQHAEVRHW